MPSSASSKPPEEEDDELPVNNNREESHYEGRGIVLDTPPITAQVVMIDIIAIQVLHIIINNTILYNIM